MHQIPSVTEITKTTKGLSLPSFAYSPPNFTDIECIDYIRYLPNYLMTHQHGIFLEATSLEEEKFINVLVKNYDYLADWLEFYVLKNTSKLDFLNRTERKLYKPIAELSIATLRLIQEVCVFVNWLDSEKISINRWWLACEWELCDILLTNRGYLGTPSLAGKVKSYNSTLAQDKEWESGDFKKNDITIDQTTPMQALEGLAWLISQHKENISFRVHFDHYRKTIKRTALNLRDSELNPVYFQDGQFCLMRRGKPKQKRIVN